MKQLQEQIDKAIRLNAKSMLLLVGLSEADQGMLKDLEEAGCGLQINAQLSTPTISVHVAGDKAKLTKVVRILRRGLFDTAEAPPAQNGESWSPTYTREGASFDIWLWFTSTVCRRVQVGTRIEEVPVYEVRCGEETES